MGHDRSFEAPPTEHVELADGRTLAFVEVGAPDGLPLVSNHGGLSCRLDIAPAHAAALARGVRIVAPDRPGIAGSEAKPGHSVAGWADDVRELADALGIDRFSVIGWSFGGAFAQSLVWHLGDRADSLSLVASVIPPDWEGMRSEIDRMDRIIYELTEHRLGRLADRSILHLMAASAAHAPKAFGRADGLDGELADVVAAAVAEGAARAGGVVTEYEVVNAPWGFDPAEITVPTHLWHGDADELLPVAWSERLHAAIEGSTLTVVPDATHFLWYDHWAEIFDAVVERRRRPE